MWGDAEWLRLQAERDEREAKLDAEQWKQGTVLEDLLKAAETDRAAMKIVTMARLLDGEAFRMREQQLEWVQRERAGRRGNDPIHQKAMRVHERVARLTIANAVRKARDVLELVDSWDDRTEARERPA